jgi:IclR family pca regulon transcriptional regulator
MQPEPSDQYVQSLVRGLAVIRAFDVEHSTMTLTEVAARTDLTRATARRFLHTLVEIGYVCTDGKTFALTPRVLQLGFSYLSALTLPAVAQPHLEGFSRDTGESSSMAVLDGNEIVYVARAAVRRIMSISISVGTRFPAYATSMGRVLLASTDAVISPTLIAHTPRSITSTVELKAELDRVRSQGFALVDQELELGLRSLAVPIVDDSGTTVAAINVSVAADAFSAAGLVKRMLPRLLSTAQGIQGSLF